MEILFLGITFAIQALAILMVLWTFHSISERRFPKLATMERYHLMRTRYEHLRWSLLFVGALIAIQLVGVFLYVRDGTIPLLQVLVSDAVVVALIVLLTRIYKARSRLQDLGVDEKKESKK